MNTKSRIRPKKPIELHSLHHAICPFAIEKFDAVSNELWVSAIVNLIMKYANKYITPYAFYAVEGLLESYAVKFASTFAPSADKITAIKANTLKGKAFTAFKQRFNVNAEFYEICDIVVTVEYSRFHPISRRLAPTTNNYEVLVFIIDNGSYKVRHYTYRNSWY